MLFGLRTLRQLRDRNRLEDLKALWRRYIIALALIFGLLMTSHVFAREALHQGIHDASTINLSGRQRMLLQRIAHTAHDYSDLQDPATREKLEQSARLFGDSHAILMEQSQKADSLKTLYTEGDLPINDQIDILLSHVDAILASPQTGQDSVASIDLMADAGLARRLDEAVTAFEFQADTRSANLTRIHDLSLLAAVVTIFAEILFIFWPTHKTISRAFESLRKERDMTEVTLGRLSRFASLAADLFWETDTEGHVIYAEGSFLSRMKGGRETIIGCNYQDLIQMSDENQAELLSAIQTLGSYKDVVGTFTDTDGQSYKMSMSGMPHYDDDGKIVGYLGTATDVTESLAEREAVEMLASTDPLTGLANVRKFRDGLSKMLETADLRHPVHVLALDLDGFKAVNDTYGHGAGDEVLKVVAARMKGMLRSTDWCARIGGDEFFVVCHTAPSRLAVEGLALRLNRKLAEPYGLSCGHRVRVSASIGIAAAPYDAIELEELLKAADMALYSAKRSGRNQFCFHEDLEPALQDAAG